MKSTIKRVWWLIPLGLIGYIIGFQSCVEGADFPEKYYQEKWCLEQQGITELLLSDDTRPDCITKEYAVEFDWGSKWAEAIGQSLHYSQMTGLKPKIVLIIDPKDTRYIFRLFQTINYHKILIDVEYMEREYP